MYPQQQQEQHEEVGNGNISYDDYFYASTTIDDSNSNNDVDVIVTIEEPDDTSDLMLHLEDSVAAPPAYDNHDLFYHHYDHDPLLYFAEYNKNNPIDMDNDDDEDNNDIDTIMESAEELQQAIQIDRGTSFHKLEPISEDEEEGEEQYNHFR